MGINAAQPGREIKQFHAHGKHDPRHCDAGPHGPSAAQLAVAVETEPAPQGIVDDADDDVGGHVVGVVPADELQVSDMAGVQQDAEQRPHAQHRAPARRLAVEPEDAHDGVVRPVQDAGAGGEVVELLGGGKVAGVEDGAEGPGGEAKAGEDLVVRAHGVVGRDLVADLLEALPVRPEVAEGEEHGEGLLDADEAVKGPFAVELDDVEVGGDAGGGDDVLAGVVAFGGAVPEEEAAGEGYWSSN